MWNFIKTEPIYFMGLIQALIAAILGLVLALGVTVTADVGIAIQCTVMAVLVLVMSLIARQKVYASATVKKLIDAAKK
jgi:Mg2+/Co2+ transporter CorB